MIGFVVQGHIFALKFLQNQHKWVPTADQKAFFSIGNFVYKWNSLPKMYENWP